MDKRIILANSDNLEECEIVKNEDGTNMVFDSWYAADDYLTENAESNFYYRILGND